MLDSATPEVVFIVNPTAGTGPGGRARVEMVTALDEGRGRIRVLATERAGHARELAAAAIGWGATRIVAWGGDGTVNEVASVVGPSTAALGVVPNGSGNGFAREMGIPLDVTAAFRVAVTGVERTVDMGEVDGRPFVNVAGIGLDAQVALRFAQIARHRRGLARYVQAATQELFSYRPPEFTLDLGEGPRRVRPAIVAFANTRQYGNGAFIAPEARPDDGVLDVVVVGARPLWRLLAGVPALFAGRIGQLSDVSMQVAREVRLAADSPLACHVDGEPMALGTSATVRILPAALRVIVPRATV